MSERAPCCIIGCRRTFRRDAEDDGFVEYICGDHYRLADKAIRTLRTAIKRKARRHGWLPRFVRIDNWLWARAKRQATERSMGL